MMNLFPAAIYLVDDRNPFANGQTIGMTSTLQAETDSTEGVFLLCGVDGLSVGKQKHHCYRHRLQKCSI